MIKVYYIFPTNNKAAMTLHIITIQLIDLLLLINAAKISQSKKLYV